MTRWHRLSARYDISAPFVLLVLFLCVLWVAGGASRADAFGQVIVRGAAWALLMVSIIAGDAPGRRDINPVALLLFGALALALLQLVPLPPAMWQALPGREMLTEAAAASGQAQPWRPWSIVPEATANAASSMIVPIVTFVLAIGIRPSERARVPTMILGLIVASMFLGLIQASNGGFDNPLINDVAGQVSGPFANRNHFAVFTAIGCLIAPVWTFQSHRVTNWRIAIALSLLLLFALMIMAIGSRAGLITGAVACAIGLLLARRGIGKVLSQAPRWALPASIVLGVALIAAFVLLSISADRAVSINRAFAVDTAEDMRVRGLPTVIAMIKTYFPLGTGLGSFDPLFRIHEPVDLLKITYFNHAHDDYLEIALQAGLPGILLLACGLLWWAYASFRVWRDRGDATVMLGRLGSGVLLLIFVASAFDYPARTPTIMAMIVLAGLWLSWGAKAAR